ncbi:MAG: GGDEF domain-containing phosphodiesterase, partial [Succinivibrio sp.]|nr:GGDEF domain-containing phosphodiesterase [Succinivibrio sp.]
ALNNVTDLIFVTDPLTKEILYANKSFCETTGLRSIRGCTCYGSLRKRATPCTNCQNMQAFENGFQITHNNLKLEAASYAVKSAPVQVGDKVYNLNIMKEREDYQHQQFSSPLSLSSAVEPAELYALLAKNNEDPNLQLYNALCLLGRLAQADTVSVYEPKKMLKHSGSAYLRTVFYAQNQKSDLSDRPEDDLSSELVSKLFNEPSEVYLDESGLSRNAVLSPLLLTELKTLKSYPLQHHEQIIGRLFLRNPKPELLSEHQKELQLVVTLIEHLLIVKQQASELYHLKNSDNLTKTANRNALMQDLVEYDQLERVGVILVNLNGLKHINHYEGFAVGDKALVQTCELIKQIIDDQASLYRVSGDEFLCVCCEIEQSEFTQKANALSLLLSHETNFSAAVGSAYTATSGQFSVLMQLAQSDMFTHKREYYRRHPVNERYRNDKDDVLDMVSVEKINELLENHSFSLRYQPKYSLQRYGVSGAEALIRLELEGRLIAANDFIPTLDAAHLTYLIDYFVIEQVCAKLRERIDKGLKIVPISCNLSRHTLVRQDFLSRLKSIFAKYQIPYQLVPLELSERSNSLYHKELTDVCIALATHGFILTIDDFGVAQANIWALSDLPVSEIKFDKKLIDSLNRQNNFKIITILNVMVTLCNKMHIKTIAEGVDRKEQRDILEKIGCSEIQGYYYSKPIPEEAFYRLL